MSLRWDNQKERSYLSRQLTLLFLLSSLIHLTSCCEEELPTENGGEINPNIKMVKYCCSDFGSGNFRMGVWFDSSIFAVAPGRLLRVNENLDVVSDTLLLWPGAYLFASVNTSGSKILSVKSQYTDVSVGSLIQLDLATLQIRTLKDSTFEISSAHYLQGDTLCVYYSYGNATKGISPGYYLFNITTGQDSLILSYISDLGPLEVTNGFDISPDNTKLLIPLNSDAFAPMILEYDLTTSTADTINVSFDRQLLWLRYHPSGNEIVYANYPRGSGGSTVATDSEIGTIDISTNAKMVLDVNTEAGGLSVSIFPNWSPDGKDIIYGSAPGPVIEPPGAKGAFSLYVLRGVN